MDNLIQIVSDLQTIYRKIGVTKSLDLPQIVVVGAQSSGKSSTLESLVGKEFLPRGDDIVTRRPLQLELINIPEDKTYNGSKEWAVFPGDPPSYPKTFVDFEDVCAEIEQQTEDKAEGKSICDDPIILKVYSPDVCTLTLIDLPGLTEVPVMNQPQDVPQQIKRLVLKYITPPKSIILAVHPANVDAANCGALKIAKQVDPEGVRTIAVITKLDRLQRGTNILPLFTGKIYDQPLLGIVGIYNRTPSDGADFSNKEAKIREEEYLMENYPPDVASAMGVDYLASQLSKILINHILQFLPEIKSDIDNEILRQQNILESLGESLSLDEKDLGPKLTAILAEYTRKIANYVDGVYEHTEEHKIIGGARIKEIFTEDFAQEMELVDPVVLMREKVKTVVENAAGVAANIFSPDAAFQMLARRYITQLLDPSLFTVEQVHAELTLIAELAWNALHICARFPKLRAHVFNATSEFLRDALDKTKKQVEILLNKEMAYINTNHRNIMEYMKKHAGERGSESRLGSGHMGSQSQLNLPQEAQKEQEKLPGHKTSKSSPSSSLLNLNIKDLKPRRHKKHGKDQGAQI